MSHILLNQGRSSKQWTWGGGGWGIIFFPLKINKIPGYDEISFNVLKKCFSNLREPLKYMFNLPIEIFQMT